MTIKVKNSKVVHKNPYFEVVKDELTCTNEDDKKLEHEYYYITGGNFVSIIVQDGDEFLFVKQYRQPVKMHCYEFVAGMCEENEDPQVTAKRELEEETGYIAEKFQILGKIYPLVADCSMFGYVVFTDSVVDKIKDQDRKLDDFEKFTNLKSMWFTEKEISKMILENEINTGATLSAWAIYKEYSKGLRK